MVAMLDWSRKDAESFFLQMPDVKRDSRFASRK